MTSFQTKISWKRRTKGENKNYRFVPFRSFPTGNRKLKKKIAKKFKQFKNTIMDAFHAKTGWTRPTKREKIKTIVSFRSCTRHKR